MSLRRVKPPGRRDGGELHLRPGRGAAEEELVVRHHALPRLRHRARPERDMEQTRPPGRHALRKRAPVRSPPGCTATTPARCGAAHEKRGGHHRAGALHAPRPASPGRGISGMWGSGNCSEVQPCKSGEGWIWVPLPPPIRSSTTFSDGLDSPEKPSLPGFSGRSC
jgi:hypothetical protein